MRQNLKLKIFFLIILFCGVFGVAGKTFGATRNVTCSGDITTALTSATSLAIDGDVVNISVGSCNVNPAWDNGVGWVDKNITLQGQGHGSCAGSTCSCNPSVDTCLTTDDGLMNTSGIYSSETNSTKMAWRVTNIFLTSLNNGGGFSLSNDGYNYPVQPSGTSYGWRIDHMTFYYPNTCGPHAITIRGLAFGLIDHNYFVMNCESTIIYDGEFSSEDGSINNIFGAYNLAQPFQPGSLNAIYIEDNTFVASSTGPYGASGYAAIDSGYRGGRIVFRHNTLTDVGLYSHWTTGGSVNTQWWEVYNNKFSWDYGGDWLTPMRIHGGGTGLIYDNTFVGWPENAIRIGEGRLPEQDQTGAPLLYCDGTHAWDGNAGDASAPGWPCLAQTGRAAGKTMAQILSGDKQTTFPLYVWNNGLQDKCYDSSALGLACDNSFGVVIYSGVNYFKSTPHVTAGFGNGDVDYSITASQPSGAGNHTLTYTPLIYPHPLQDLIDVSHPEVPTGLAVN
ncbi:MAG: hypothetical protein WC848_06000 [Parcubacteria group bacterium]